MRSTFYRDRDGAAVSETEAIDHAGTLREGYSVRVPAMMMDARPVLGGDRMTLADVADIAELPKAIPEAIARDLRPIAESLRDLRNRENAVEIMHKLELAMTKLLAQLDNEKRNVRLSSYPPGIAAGVEVGWPGLEAAIDWCRTVHATIQAALVAIRDGAQGHGWDRAIRSAGLPLNDAAAPAPVADAHGWGRAAQRAGLAKR